MELHWGGSAPAACAAGLFLLHNACRICSSLPTAVSGLWPGWDMFVLVFSMNLSVWPHDHGPTNVEAMIKRAFCILKMTWLSHYIGLVTFTFVSHNDPETKGSLVGKNRKAFLSYCDKANGGLNLVSKTHVEEFWYTVLYFTAIHCSYY